MSDQTQVGAEIGQPTVPVEHDQAKAGPVEKVEKVEKEKPKRGRRRADEPRPFHGPVPSDMALMVLPVPKVVMEKVQEVVKRVSKLHRVVPDQNCVWVEVCRNVDWTEAVEEAERQTEAEAKKFLEWHRKLNEHNTFGFQQADAGK